jgi:hypothetical protein
MASGSNGEIRVHENPRVGAGIRPYSIRRYLTNNVFTHRMLVAWELSTTPTSAVHGDGECRAAGSKS